MKSIYVLIVVFITFIILYSDQFTTYILSELPLGLTEEVGIETKANLKGVIVLGLILIVVLSLALYIL